MYPLTRLLDLLCPPICPICGNVIENAPGQDEPLCSICVQKSVTPDGQFCRRCGGRRFVAAHNTEECPRCRTADFRFKRVITLGEYEHDLRLAILRMKTDSHGILVTSAARALARYRHTDLQNAEADIIVPVPMHRLRRNDRGVNSPDLLAEELSRHLKIPVVRNRVRRVRSTDLQYTLSPRGRIENMKEAFAISSPHRFIGIYFATAPLTGKNILLVDDILTTGATCNEVTKVLLASGVRSVTVAVLARAEGNYGRNITP